MVRRSGRLSASNDALHHKRAASGSGQVSGAKKSKKEQIKSEEDSDDAEISDAEDESADGEAESDLEFGNSDGSLESDSEDVEEDDYQSDHDSPNKKKSRQSATKAPAKGQPSDEVWRPGVKAGLGPGNQVIIKKPKARPAGSTPYSDETIHPNTMLFLADLKKNNDRQWLKLHDADFRQSEKDWQSFVEKMTEKLIEIDETIPELPVKDVIFRIYRDIRFSKDPTPYKSHFSVGWSRTGRKSTYAHYYLQIAPGKSFMGGGLWQPDAAPMTAMRNAIDQDSQRLKDVLIDAGIRKEFLDGAAKSHSAAAKAFIKANNHNALKTKPKGFDGDHADIDLLRLKNFALIRKLEDDEILGTRGVERIAQLLRALKPYVSYCNDVVMPDEAPDEDPENEEEDDDESTDGE